MGRISQLASVLRACNLSGPEVGDHVEVLDFCQQLWRVRCWWEFLTSTLNFNKLHIPVLKKSIHSNKFTYLEYCFLWEHCQNWSRLSLTSLSWLVLTPFRPCVLVKAIVEITCSSIKQQRCIIIWPQVMQEQDLWCWESRKVDQTGTSLFWEWSGIAGECMSAVIWGSALLFWEMIDWCFLVTFHLVV